MKSSTKILFLLCISFMAFCSYFLYMELTRRVDKTGGEAIGTITFKKRSASRKYTDNVIWEEIDQESEIFNYDAIRTMEYSSAVISLKDGTKIELDQNTLLVVVLSDKGLNINFDKGGVSARSGVGSKNPITLNSKDASIALDSGGISVNSSDAGMNIQVNSGSVKVASDGKELQLSANDITTLKDGVAQSQKATLFPQFPAQNSNLITFGKTRNVNFLWRSEPQGEVKLDISHSSDFKNILKSYKSRKTVQDVTLPAGDYYWRVARGGTASYPVKFSVINDIKPRLIAPQKNQKLSVTEVSGMVPFRWEKSKYAAGYELTAARDSKMSDVVVSLTSRVNTISAKGFKPGRYYWTVKSIYPPEIISGEVVSGPEIFEVEKFNFNMVKPVPLDQGPVTTAAPFTLHWKGVAGAEGYKVELASDQGFENIIVTKNTSDSLVTIDQKLREGRYFWRVSTLLGTNVSATSVTAILSLISPADIILLNPPAGTVLLDKPETINFTWRDPNRGEKYLIEISGTGDFRNIKHSRESSQPGTELKSPAAGNYFWRVILKDNSGSIIAQSAVSEFIIPDELKIPVTVSPKANDRIIPGLKKSLRFEWSKVTGADEYEVQIFQRIAGVEKSLIIYSSESNHVDIINQTIFTPGIYSWMVKAKQVRNGRVAAYKESEKSYFNVEEVILLPAPDVKTPGIIFK